MTFEEWRAKDPLDDEYYHRNDMYWYAALAWEAAVLDTRKSLEQPITPDNQTDSIDAGPIDDLIICEHCGSALGCR